jgi:hypothetical protein
MNDDRHPTHAALIAAEPGDGVSINGTAYTVAPATAETSGGLVLEEATDRLVYATDGCAWESDVPGGNPPNDGDLIPFEAVKMCEPPAPTQ